MDWLTSQKTPAWPVDGIPCGLVITATLLSVVIGIPIGFVAAHKP